MRKTRMIRAALCMSALLLTGACAQSIAAEESEAGLQPETALEAAAAVESEEAAAEQEVPAPQTRPDYTASDYVQAEDGKYKGLAISVYPPADSSAEAQTAYQTTVDTAIMTQLFTLYPVKDYPQDLLAYVTQGLTGTYREYAEMYGLDFASFLQTYLQMDESTFKAQVRKAAEQTLKEEMILKAIAEQENLAVSDEEYEQGCVNYAAKYGYESADTLKQAFDEPTIRISLLMDKTFEYLETVTDITQIIETETETETESGAAETESES